MKFNRFKKDKSILFHNPDYHCTFEYKTHLQELGWKVDIFVDQSYSSRLLWSTESIIRLRNSKLLSYSLWFIFTVPKYQFLFFYGRPRNSIFLKKVPLLRGLAKLGFNPLLSWATFFGTKIVYLPSGCRDIYSRALFQLFDSGNVCGNCSFFANCDENSNLENLAAIRRYSALNIGWGWDNRNLEHIDLTPILWKSIDLELWNPRISVPDKFRIKRTAKYMIYHSTSLESRGGTIQKNIKGTRYLMEAVEKLRAESYDCDLLYVTGVSSKDVRFYMSQSDIVVDQLIYGGWGSTSIEAMSLGKPTICYIREEWKKNYLLNFNLRSLPFVEANTQTIYEVLKSLLDNPAELERLGKASRHFAETNFNTQINAKRLVVQLDGIRA